MTAYRKAKDEPVAHYPTKYDECTLVETGLPYKFQKGSGRSEILVNWGKPGLKLGELTRLAAEHGFDPNFTVSAVLKQHDTKDGGWKIEPPEGKTLVTIKAERQPRRVDPTKAAEKAAQEEAKATRKQAIEQAKTAKIEERNAKAAEKARLKEEKAAEKAKEKEAAKEAKAAEKAAADAAKAAIKEAEAGTPHQADGGGQEPAAEHTEQPETAHDAPKQAGRRVKRGAMA